MTPALKLFEHLADFSEEQPLAVESFEEEFVPLIAPGLQGSEADSDNFDPFAQPEAGVNLDDPFAVEPALTALEPELPGSDAIMPISGDDPFEPGLQMPVDEIRLGEPDVDPFGPEPTGLAADDDPFATDVDPLGADTLLPASDLLEPEDDPFGPQVGPDADTSEMTLAEAEPGILSAESGMSSEIPPVLQNSPDETLIDQGGIPADDPVFAEALDTFGEPPSENDQSFLPAEPEGMQENLVDPGPVDADARPAETLQIQEETESRIAQGFATALAEAEEKLTELVCSSVAGILAGILNDELVRKSIEALAGQLREIAGSGGALRIDVRGPASLFEKLKAALGENAPEFRYTEDDLPDLTIEIDSQIVSSRIGEWRQSVEGCFS